jgi:signal transduction histidine kinase/pSer/pThr/pTyr-binding forkhead associated (FHA) protein
MIVGRDSRQLPITDNTVSRRHCELIPENGEWVLKDLGSANGSYVNGIRVNAIQYLKLGDQVRVGRTLLLFGAQPGISRSKAGNLKLAGEESGMDSAIVAAIPSSEDSMVLAVPEPSAAAMANLKMLYQLGAALGSSFDVDQVAEVVMDLVFEHIKADRGILLLLDERGEQLTPKVVRTREEEANGGGNNGSPKQGASEKAEKAEKIHASRTIIDHVIENGQGVLSSNAMTDQRFSKGKSVHSLGIRSCLCVPIKARRLDVRAGGEEILGVIYIDSSVKNYTYSQDQLRLLTTIGLQAGLAIQNAKLYQAGLQAERMAAIGETTAALSHSIKNILQALRGGADVVEMGFRNSNLTQAHKGWGIVDRNLEKIYNLTLNLLAYSKDRDPKLDLVNPRKLVDDCVELVAPHAAQKGAMVVADVDRDMPPIPMDPDGMHQVVMNLLSNALDAVGTEGGLIRVVCRYDAAEKELVLEVIDNGSGIPEPMKKHMFELFHSTKGNRGTGLGLAVARKIVSEHEGTIAVQSREGEGSTFTVRLPVEHSSLSDPSHTHGPGR